ncbi:PD-(D/E)XK nuclease family protein [Kitasatospora purpeofusca]|uniref:PD-(D/E)XK nuclease family protein n=1 Tax=Kitasatospora purpeofusca TaxID=67352 RepID=A0ABZ1U4B3_9ACTN|nr:PD-(D/E)XK nuclease family protein [Kitasatospora purpeofusca]
MATWLPPPGSSGRTDLIRVFAGTARVLARRCGYKTAFKARPGLRAPSGPLPGYKADSRESFNLGPASEALDLVEYQDVAAATALDRVLQAKADRPATDPGLAAWTRTAVSQYLAGGTERLVPVRHPWVRVTTLSAPDARGVRRYEQCVWGRPYTSYDGSVRELWIPVASSLSNKDPDPSQVAAAAMVVAFGTPHRLPDRFHWKENAEPVGVDTPDGARLPALVRIREVSCLDGTRRLVDEETPGRISERYQRIGRPELADAVSSGEFIPGHDCEDCKLVPVCPALRRTSGLLGIEDTTQPRRIWSITNGRSYAGRPGRDEACAAREHLRRLWLPDRTGHSLSPAVVRGHAVHAWIQEQHESRPGVACRAEDAPDSSAPWSAGRWTVSEAEAETGSRMVAAHARHCPYQLSTVTTLAHERSLIVHDTAADVLVTAKADLLYRDDTSWVYRETKTDARLRTPRQADLLRKVPQLALAVLLMERLDSDPTASRVELEVLGPGGARLMIVDPSDPIRRAEARQVVHDLAVDWHTDTTALPRPGQHCRSCDMAEWCQPGPLSGPAAEQGVRL